MEQFAPYIKIFGIVLLVAGVLLIGWTLVSSYNIFTGSSPAPEFFSPPAAEGGEKAGGQDIQAQMEQMIGEQLKGILPVESITQMLNLAVWSMLAFLLMFGGTQVSSIGIKLIKK